MINDKIAWIVSLLLHTAVLKPDAAYFSTKLDSETINIKKIKVKWAVPRFSMAPLGLVT